MFATPLGLLALLGVPAVALLHLYRRRFRPRPVSALFLWVEDDETLSAGRRRERLRRSASLWLELAAALLAGLVLGGPRACGPADVRHLVCVLDSSASMGASDGPPGGPSGGPSDGIGDVARAAADEVRERLAELPGGSRVTLIASGTRPSVLAGPAAFPAEARAALEAWRPGAARHDLAPAVALGLQLSGGGTVVVVTDRLDAEAHPPEVELVALGRPRDNLAITHATRLRERADTGEPVDRLLVTVASFAAGPAARTLSIGVPGSAPLEARRVELDPGRRRHLAFDVPADTPTVVVALEPDALAVDDVATLAPVPPRVLALATTLSPPAAHALGLGAGDDPGVPGPLERWVRLVPHAVAAGSPEGADLLIGDPAAGGPATWTLRLAEGRDLDPEAADFVAPFLVERSHPLLDGVTLEGVVWSTAAGAQMPGTPLVSAGDRPLLTEELGPRRRVWHLDLDPFRSTLPLSPDWPILLANLAELRRAALPGARRTNLAVGEPLVFEADAPASYVLRPLLLAELAGGAPLPPPRELRARDVLVVEDLARPGLWALESEGRELARVGVSFRDPAESDLRGAGSGHREPSGEAGRTAAVLGPLGTILAAGAAVCLVLDWLVLAAGRRRASGARTVLPPEAAR